MIVRSRAPLRISFSGGGTDVPPYPQERGGVVLSTTINKYAYTSLIPQEEPTISVQSLDYDIVAHYNVDEKLTFNGELDLIKAVINRFGCQGGVQMFLHSDAPPGSGLGSSSTMMVALVGLMAKYLKKPVTLYDIAQLAYEIERKDLAIKGGMQDQYAATFGGFNFIEFNKDSVVVNPLRIDPHVLNELEYHLILCYTGKTRLSANILNTQVDAYVQKQEDVVNALDELKALTIDMKNALLQGKLNDFGELLHVAWDQKKKLAKQITNPHIDELYAAARGLGALGGKILGAGGGGYLLVYSPFQVKHLISQRLEELGGQVIEFGFDMHGLQTWTVNQ
jgi:D-glycero-alpha-D-manno-heptose-7-phosphate kinase